MIHVCMMHISLILDLDPEACMYGVCIYDAANFVTNERTDEQGDSGSRIRDMKNLDNSVDPQREIQLLNREI